MRAAIRNSGLEFPRERILINLSPADLKKEGSSFDLPIALAVLLASENAEPGGNRIMVLGELELSGTVRGVKGVLSAVSRGLENGIRWYIVPEANRKEAEIRTEANVIGVPNLSTAINLIKTIRMTDADACQLSIAGTGSLPITDECPLSNANTGSLPIANTRAVNTRYSATWSDSPRLPDDEGYEDLRGQDRLVRALQIAAAGGHHLIAYGPPGCGKTLALRRFPLLLPDLDEETAVTVTRIYSIAGLIKGDGSDAGKEALFRRPPFREPHPNASLEGIAGGGKNCRPGEISLAHGGVLFLDEATQFRSSVLQSLRSPLETGSVTVSRAGRTDTFPSRFQLLMAVNPCPCGNYGTAGRICTCTSEMIEQYWKKMTAPLLDRIDLRVDLQSPSAEEINGGQTYTTATLREEIARAREIQNARNKTGSTEKKGESWLNAHIGSGDIERLCMLEGRVGRIFEKSMQAARLSGRGAHGILKTARTIADLEAAEKIGEDHILEAVQFRRWKGAVPDFLQE
jgi:magnesium chelatase family protein